MGMSASVRHATDLDSGHWDRFRYSKPSWPLTWFQMSVYLSLSAFVLNNLGTLDELQPNLVYKYLNDQDCSLLKMNQIGPPSRGSVVGAYVIKCWFLWNGCTNLVHTWYIELWWHNIYSVTFRSEWPLISIHILNEFHCKSMQWVSL